MNRIKYQVQLGLLAFSFSTLLSAADAVDSKALVNDFWEASTAAELQSSQEQLLAAAGNVETLYRWLRTGPDYSADVPVGQLDGTRVDSQGVSFPYVYLVPENYDPSVSYPVEVMLHGGVSRSAYEEGETWWRRGYDSLQQDDRIVIVPAAWREAFWWHDNQADNVPAILKTLKQTYNIDDNRVTLSGNSDGGTGAYFFAFKQPTEWAAFLPFIGHPGVLRNPQSGGGYKLFFENLERGALYIVNGENDPLYPASSLQPFIDILAGADINHTFTVIEGGGHNTSWLPQERPKIEQFKLDNPRDPLPDEIQWVADRSDRYNRNLWIRVDGLSEESQPGILKVERDGNMFDVSAEEITAFTLLLNPEEVNFAEPVVIRVNGTLRYQDLVPEKMATLLEWARYDLDKTMLYTAELNLRFAD